MNWGIKQQEDIIRERRLYLRTAGLNLRKRKWGRGWR